MAIDVGAISKLTEGVDALRTFAQSVAGGADKPADGGTSVPGDSAAVVMARKARESYQKTARWMLGAFAAVGVLIFGSLPFADVADVELTWPDGLLLIGGLVLAVAGIVTAVMAVSLVSEPEDASLGELDCDLRAVQRQKDGKFAFDEAGKPLFATDRLALLRRWWNPRLRAKVQLADILHGTEADAHLGPNLGEQPTVTDLIRKLQELESKHAPLSPAVAKLAVTVATHEKRVADLTALLEKVPTDEARTKYTEAAAALDEARLDHAAKLTRLAEIDDQLKMYHDHRSLVLAESGVMQLRGTFRLARRILAVAAVLTLVGGTAYALSLPGSAPEEESVTAPPSEEPAAPVYATGLPATVLVHEGTAPAAELPRECVNRPLAATWVGTGRIPASVGPFTAVVTDPACTGQLTVERGEGTFALSR
jgi:hypothetical protein